jgi:nucleotide-binding universal stress UspA family protein
MKRILVALDSSERAPAVLAAAADVARWSGAKLVLFRAIGLPVEMPVEAYRLSPSSLESVLRRDADEALAKLASTEPSLVESVRVGVGTAWSVICGAARELDVDLVVIGSHGFGPLDRLLGTTAARVVNHCDRSVLVVRPVQP